MIIQCRKCGTKYRFDKAKVTGKGVWVRCRNCETVFFQKNPLGEISSLMDLADPERITREEAPEEVAGVAGEEGEGEPTWEDAYRGTGEGIAIEGAGEEEPGEEAKEAAAEEKAEGEPTWEDAYHEAGEGIAIEGAGEEEPEEETKAAAGEEGEGEPTWEDAYQEAGEGLEIEGAGEEEPEEEMKETAAEEIEAEGGEPEPIEEISPGAGEGLEIEGMEEEHTRGEEVEAGDVGEGPKWEDTYEDVGEIPEGEEAGGRQRVREPWSLGGDDEVMYNEKVTGKRRLRRLVTLVIKVVLYLALVALLSGGAYLWLVPEARESILNKAIPWVEKTLGIAGSGGIEGVKQAVLPKVEKILGMEDEGGTAGKAPELRVTLVNVGERFVKGWTEENIMVVEGSAVNTNQVPVSGIAVRGKILDASGSVLSEEESNCGTILTDDELKSLTTDEIKKELSNPYGRDFHNADIQPGDGIPFMLVFTMPAEEATELVVELTGIKAAGGK